MYPIGPNYLNLPNNLEESHPFLPCLLDLFSNDPIDLSSKILVPYFAAFFCTSSEGDILSVQLDLWTCPEEMR